MLDPNYNDDLNRITNISKNIFLSGVNPLAYNPRTIINHNIKYILTCAPQNNYMLSVYEKLFEQNPNITIMTIPYYDDIKQNLWKRNDNNIKIIKGGQIHNEKIYDNKPFIDISFHFIESALETKNNILIHCMAGISRSVSVIIYYLIKKYRLTYQNSLDFLRSKRKICNPNPSFKFQLILFQNMRENTNEQVINKKISPFFV